MEQMRAREREKKRLGTHTPLDSICVVQLCGHGIGRVPTHHVPTHHACHHTSLPRHPHARWRSLHSWRQRKIGVGGRGRRLSVHASPLTPSHGRVHQEGLLPRDHRNARQAASRARTHTHTAEHVTWPAARLCGNALLQSLAPARSRPRLPRATTPRGKQGRNLDVPARGHGDGVLRQAVDALLPHGLL